MLTTTKNYLLLFKEALEAKRVDLVKSLLIKFKVRGSELNIHNLSLSLVAEPDLSNQFYQKRLGKALQKMALTPVQ